MILRIIQLQSAIETRGSCKSDLFGWGEAIASGVQSSAAIYNNERSLALQKAMFEEQRDMAQEQFYKNLEFQHKMTYLGQDFQREMWQRQIDYNDPSAQMERLMNAGINPNSAAGMISPGGAVASGTVSSPSGGTSSLPSGSVPHLSNPMESIGQYISKVLGDRQAQADVDNTRADTDKKEAETRNLDEQTRGLIIDNDWKPFEKEANVELAKSQADAAVASGELSRESATQIKEMLPYLKDLNVAQQYKLYQDARVAIMSVGQIQANINLLTQQIETEKARVKELDAAAYEHYMSAGEKGSNIMFNNARISLTEAETTLSTLKGERQKAQNDFEDNLRKQGINPDEHNPLVSVMHEVGQILSVHGNSLEQFNSSVTEMFNNLWHGTRKCYNPAEQRLNTYGDGFR